MCACHTSMEDRCTGSAPSRLAHGSAARGMLGADGADFAARRERAARQSSSRRANDRTTHATSRTACHSTPISEFLLFPTQRALMEASRPEMSPLGGAGRSHVMAAQHAAAQHSVRRSSGRLNQVECTLQLVRVLWWYVYGFVSETQVHVGGCCGHKCHEKYRSY